MSRPYVRTDPSLSPEERRREITRRYRAAHREERAAYLRAWRAEHPEETERWWRAYYAARRERFADLARQYDERHRAERAEAVRLRRVAHPELAREYSERRRALQRGATVAPVDLRVIFDRDCGCCHLCGAVVQWELAWPNPMSMSLDHVIPLSRGGTHEPANVALAHLQCNIRKGARLI